MLERDFLNFALNFLLACLVLTLYQKARYQRVHSSKTFLVTLISCLLYMSIFEFPLMLFPLLNTLLHSHITLFYSFANLSNTVIFVWVIHLLLDRNGKISIFLFTLLWSSYQLILYTFNNMTYLFSGSQTGLYYLISFMNLGLTYLVINYLVLKSHLQRYLDGLEMTWPQTIGCSLGFLLIYPVMQLIIQREGPGFMALEQLVLTLVVFFLLACFYLVIQSVQAKVHQKYLRMMLQQQNLYIQSLESIQLNMRAFKHDYHNLMVSLYLQSKEGKAREIEQRLAHMLHDFDETIGEKMNLVGQLGKIKISEIKSLLMEKLTIMQSKQIPVKLEILYEIQSVNMDIIDLVRLLGILLDNSIEEVEVFHGDIVVILLDQEGSLDVHIENAVHAKIDINQISQPGYSTKGTGRGMGLASLKNILRKYPHISHQIICENDRLIQKITILKKGACGR